MHMHTNVILTNKRRTHAQPNYINTKLKTWFRCLLCHPARKHFQALFDDWLIVAQIQQHWPRMGEDTLECMPL